MPPGTGRAEAAYPSAVSPSASDAHALGDVVPGGGDGLRRAAPPGRGRAAPRSPARPAARRSRRGSAAPGWPARSSGGRARPGRGCSRRTGGRDVRDPWARCGPSCTVIWSVASRTPRCRRIPAGARSSCAASSAAETGPAVATICSTRWRVPASESGVEVSDRVRSIAGSVAFMHTSVGSGPVSAAAQQPCENRAAILATSLLPISIPASKETLRSGSRPSHRHGRPGALDFPLVPDSPALEISGLVKRYGGRAVVDGLDLVAHHGQVTAVLGPNGAGKTTTVECCEGLREPDGGTRARAGPRPGDAGPRPAPARRRHAAGRRPADGRQGARDARARRAGCTPTRGTWASSPSASVSGRSPRTTVRRLSGGQRQRLALAAAIVGRPEVVFLDEPSAGMDPQTRHAVWDLVRELRDEGVAVVLTTHLMDEAEDLADQVVVVDHGRVIAPRLGAVARVLGRGPDPAARDRRPGSTCTPRSARASSSPSRATGPTPSPAPSTPTRSPPLTAWLADAGRAGHAADRRAPHPRGRVPRPDRTEPAMSAPAPPPAVARPRPDLVRGARHPAQRRAAAGHDHRAGAGPRRADARSTGIELDTGGASRIDFLTPGVLALAVMTTSFTSQAIASSFDRRNGVLRLLSTTPLGRGGLLAGKVLGVLVVEVVQVVVIGLTALLLGWHPDPAGIALAVVAIVLGHRRVHLARPARRRDPARGGGPRRREPAAARARGRRRRRHPGRASCPGRWPTSPCCCRPERSARRCARP